MGVDVCAYVYHNLLVTGLADFGSVMMSIEAKISVRGGRMSRTLIPKFLKSERLRRLHSSLSLIHTDTSDPALSK